MKAFKPVLTYSGVWEPTNGFIHFDKLFPHIEHGFRNRTIPIAIYHVSHFTLLNPLHEFLWIEMSGIF